MPDDLIVSGGRLLTRIQVSGYLGTSWSVVDRLVKEGQLPVIYLNNRVPRFLLSDVDAFILSHRQGKISWKVWNVFDEELPIPVVMRLLDLAEEGYNSARRTNRLKDRRPETVRKFIEGQLRRKVMSSLRFKYKGKIDAQRTQMQELARRLESLECRHCHKRLHVDRDQDYAISSR